MGVQIRPITLADAASFHQLLDSVARERRYLVLLEAPPLGEVERVLRTGIEQHMPHYVAVDGKELVGWCDIRPRPEPGFTHTGRLGMGVLAEHRRCGIGRQLAAAAIEEARTFGLLRVELEVFSSNTPAIRLYESLGFVEEGCARQARYLDGNWDDLLQMGLVFQSASNK